MDDIESERRCGHVPGQNGGGHARSGQSGQRELEFVVQGDCVRECGLVFGRVASQDRTEQVWPCLGPCRAMAISCPARPAETEEAKSWRMATARRAPLDEWARIKTGSCAELVAHVVEEAGSPGECMCACVRGELAGVVA
jgi:hypothetical protein